MGGTSAQSKHAPLAPHADAHMESGVAAASDAGSAFVGAAMSSAVIPGSYAEWPASGTIRKSASGQRRDSSKAVSIGTPHSGSVIEQSNPAPLSG